MFAFVFSSSSSRWVQLRTRLQSGQALELFASEDDGTWDGRSSIDYGGKVERLVYHGQYWAKYHFSNVKMFAAVWSFTPRVDEPNESMRIYWPIGFRGHKSYCHALCVPRGLRTINAVVAITVKHRSAGWYIVYCSRSYARDERCTVYCAFSWSANTDTDCIRVYAFMFRLLFLILTCFSSFYSFYDRLWEHCVFACHDDI